jgi:hypothetical protein
VETKTFRIPSIEEPSRWRIIVVPIHQIVLMSATCWDDRTAVKLSNGEQLIVAGGLDEISK